MEQIIKVPWDIEDQKSAFDELLMVEPDPIIAMAFPYNINTSIVNTRKNGSGAITQSGVSAVVSTAAGANSFAQLITKVTGRYNPGQGILFRAAGFFTAGAAGSSQYVGYGSINDAFAFGYSGTSFGVLRRYGGVSEVRTLTVTTKSSTAENINITLNGVVKAVAVTNGADTTVTAKEIAAADYSEVGGGWEAQALGPTVIFRSYRSGALSGAYTLSGATTAVGAFAQSTVGAAANESFIAQTTWNKDKADGKGVLPVLDPTKGNVYQIRVQWLGYGAIKFYIENPTTGKLVLVHVLEYANANTATSINNPSLPIIIEATNVANTTAIALTFSSLGLYHEGKNNLRGVPHAATSTITGITTERPVLTISNNSVFVAKLNRVAMDVRSISVAVDGTKNAIVKVYKNASLVGSSFTAVEASVSVASYSSSATSLSGGTVIDVHGLAKVDNILIGTDTGAMYKLFPGETLTVTVTSALSTDAVTSVSWEEIF